MVFLKCISYCSTLKLEALPHPISAPSSAECVGSVCLHSKHVRYASATSDWEGMEQKCSQCIFNPFMVDWLLLEVYHTCPVRCSHAATHCSQMTMPILRFSLMDTYGSWNMLRPLNFLWTYLPKAPPKTNTHKHAIMMAQVFNRSTGFASELRFWRLHGGVTTGFVFCGYIFACLCVPMLSIRRSIRDSGYAS